MILFGHRGAAGEAPENTLAGARHAIERGARNVEIDLRLSADDQLVVIHDRNATRTAGINRPISLLTARELAKLDNRKVGPTWPRKSGCGTPTLKNYLKHTPEIQRYQLEIKSDKKTDVDLMVEKIGLMFPTRVSAKRIICTSFDYKLLEQLKVHSPHIRLGAISYKKPALKQAIALKCDYFCIHESLCTPSFIEKIKQHKIHLSVWTVNDPKLIKKLFKLNVDSIISDYPSMALPLINSLMRQ